MAKRKPDPLETASERALAMLAERAVIAEAQVRMLEAELAAEKQRAFNFEHECQGLALANKQWWLVFWGTFGATPEQLMKYRIEQCRETKEEAERLVYRTGGYYQSPGFDHRTPRTAVIVFNLNGDYEFPTLKR